MSDASAPAALTSGVASRFVSSNALEEAKKRREAEWKEAYARIGQEPPKQEEDEKYDPRSLFERLQENKTKKQEAFEEQLKFKNHFRALDEDEISFLDSMVEDGNEEENERKKQIEEELRSFRQAVTKRSTAPAPPAITSSLSPSLSPSLASTSASNSTPAAPTSKSLAPPVPKKTGAAGRKKSLPGVVVAKKKKGAPVPAAAVKPKADGVAKEDEKEGKEMVVGEKRSAEREEAKPEQEGDEDGPKRQKVEADSAATS